MDIKKPDRNVPTVKFDTSRRFFSHFVKRISPICSGAKVEHFEF